MKLDKRGKLTPNQSTIILNLKPLLTARNIQFPLTYLVKIGINSKSASKILHGEAVQVNFKQLTALCINLNCTPNDLFSLRSIKLPENHQLKALRKLEDEVVNPITVFENKSLEQIEKLMKDLGNKEN